MYYFKNTREWMRKTGENTSHEQEYKRKCTNNEDTSMFTINKKPRSQSVLLTPHQISKYDDTLTTFIDETVQMSNDVNGIIAKLEERIQQLENKAN